MRINFYDPDAVLAKELGVSLREMALIRRAWNAMVFEVTKVSGDKETLNISGAIIGLQWPDSDKPLRTWDGSHFVPNPTIQLGPQ